MPHPITFLLFHFLYLILNVINSKEALADLKVLLSGMVWREYDSFSRNLLNDRC